MNCGLFRVASFVLLSPLLLQAQIESLVIPAGTPEDQGLQAIAKETDAQKRLTMYQDFLQQFSSSPAAVAYANWQVSQYYQSTGDLPKALDYGDKALASAPHSLDILVSQATIAQQMKDNNKLLDYSLRGGEVYNSIGKAAKPQGMSDQDFANQAEEQKNSAKLSHHFLEAAGYNVITEEKDARARMNDIEHFTAAFPNSRFEDW